MGASTDNSVSRTFTDALQGLGDARISAFASNSNGVQYGLNGSAPVSPAFALILSPSFRQDNSPIVIVSAASVWLAVAEAYERGWLNSASPSDAQTAYENGVKASFEQWGLTVPATYLSGPASYTSGAGVTSSIGGSTVPGTNAATPTKLARIALQQWIAYYPDGLQGWSNWRRSESIATGSATGVPDLKPTVNALVPGGKIVRRYVYGVTEYSLNGAQLATEIATIPGGDTQDSRVAWDR